MAGAVKGTKGAWGEDCAAAYLRRHGYRILARNYSCRFGEIDIIAADRHYVVFVEVKLRREGGLTRPEEAMTPAKGRALLRAANCYIETCGVMLDCQIDLIAVEYAPDGSTEVRYVPDAVTLRW